VPPDEVEDLAHLNRAKRVLTCAFRQGSKRRLIATARVALGFDTDPLPANGFSLSQGLVDHKLDLLARGAVPSVS
jgi:hypothetical protein